MEEILEAAVQELQALRPGAHIRCSGLRDGHVTWEPDRVRQLLENLLVNAIKYGAPDQPVAAAWRGGADEVVLEVENRGPPIPSEHLPHVFEVGWQADARHAGGVGLGLFIAREVVRAHGGTIEVRSTPEATVFTARLPRVAAPGAGAAEAAAPAAAPAPRSSTRA